MTNQRTRQLLAILLIFLLVPVFLFAQGGLSQRSKRDQTLVAQNEQKQREKFAKAGIFSVAVTKYQYNFGILEKKGKIESGTKFDSRGNVVEELMYNMVDGSITSRTTKKYDRAGKLVEEITTRGDAKSKTLYRYNADDAVSEKVLYKKDGTIDRKWVYAYDASVNLLEMSCYLADGKLFSKDTYRYDANGNMIEHKTGSERGGPQADAVGRIVEQKYARVIYTYSYDSLENLIELKKLVKDLSAPDSLSLKISDRLTFVYDSTGRLLTMHLYKPDGSLKGRSEYTYSPSGQLTEEKDITPDGKIEYRKAYIYDKNGNIIEDSGINRNIKFRNMYKYDHFGNKTEWIAYDQINEPKLVTRYTYNRFVSQMVNLTKSEAGKGNATQPADTSSSKIPNADLYQLIGCRIVAADGMYLGMIWADKSNSHSIVNEWGQYGYEGSPTSIFNPGSQYGGSKGELSPFNKNSKKPPSLFRDSEFITYLTDNPEIKPRVSTSRLTSFLMDIAKEESSESKPPSLSPKLR